MCMWAGTCDCKYPHRSEALDPLGVELQAAVSGPTGLEIQLWLSAGAVHALNYSAISEYISEPPPHIFLKAGGRWACWLISVTPALGKLKAAILSPVQGKPRYLLETWQSLTIWPFEHPMKAGGSRLCWLRPESPAWKRLMRETGKMAQNTWLRSI